MTAIDFRAFVERARDRLGETILPFFRTSLSVEDKSRGGSFDPVTAADRAAENAMRALIRSTFPSHGIVGEEFGSERADAEYVWVLDPIDGTKSFISGMPAWGTLIALTAPRRAGLRHDAPAVHARALHRRRRRGAAIAGRPASAPDGAPVRGADRRGAVHHQPAADEARRPRALFGKVEEAVRLSRYGGDCYAYCMLAAGHVDLVIETELKPHDMLPLIPIIDGAGGIMTNWEGGPANTAAASSPRATGACTRRRWRY